jgi:iron-sulfur cluster repair protein YtfE (RIC family)
LPITPETKIGQIFREYPRAIDYLLEHNICECDFATMKRTLREVAEERGLDLEKLLEELNKRA